MLKNEMKQTNGATSKKILFADQIAVVLILSGCVSSGEP